MAMRLWLCASVLFTCFTPARARADIDSELVNQGVAAYKALDYAKAVGLLERALAESLTREEKEVALRTLGFCHVALDQPQLARGDFEKALTLDPAYNLDRTVSPRVRAVFEEARAAVAMVKDVPTTAGQLPTLSPVAAPAKPKEGEPVDIAVVYPGGAAHSARLFWRTKGKRAFSQQVASAPQQDSSFTIRIPGINVEAPAIEYYIEVLDSSGLPLAAGGELAAPLSFNVIAKKKPIYKKAWFWGTIGGVIVAGAIVGIVVAVTSSSSSSQPAVIHP